MTYRSLVCRMLRTLVQLMRTLDRMPEEPPEYEPPFFRGCKEEETRNLWTKNSLKMEVGNINSKHLVLVVKVMSVLDLCEDENDDIQDDAVSLGVDSMQWMTLLILTVRWMCLMLRRQSWLYSHRMLNH